MLIKFYDAQSSSQQQADSYADERMDVTPIRADYRPALIFPAIRPIQQSAAHVHIGCWALNSGWLTNFNCAQLKRWDQIFSMEQC